jgi:hypothetical protein
MMVVVVVIVGPAISRHDHDFRFVVSSIEPVVMMMVVMVMMVVIVLCELHMAHILRLQSVDSLQPFGRVRDWLQQFGEGVGLQNVCWIKLGAAWAEFKAPIDTIAPNNPAIFLSIEPLPVSAPGGNVWILARLQLRHRMRRIQFARIPFRAAHDEVWMMPAEPQVNIALLSCQRWAFT